MEQRVTKKHVKLQHELGKISFTFGKTRANAELVERKKNTFSVSLQTPNFLSHTHIKATKSHTHTYIYI